MPQHKAAARSPSNVSRYDCSNPPAIDKRREALVAVWLETRFSKEEFLTRYLNSVYPGTARTAWLPLRGTKCLGRF
jgi:hypothetical protein